MPKSQYPYYKDPLMISAATICLKGSRNIRVPLNTHALNPNAQLKPDLATASMASSAVLQPRPELSFSIQAYCDCRVALKKGN